MKHIKTFEQAKVNSLELINATINNDLEKVKELLKHPNIDVNIKNNDGDTALIWASHNGNLDIVKELLKHPDIDVNIQDKYDNTAILIILEKIPKDVSYKSHDNIYVLYELLKHPNIDVNIQNMYLNSFLLYSTEINNINLVKMFFNKNGNINKLKHNNWTPLHWAVYYENEEIIKILIKNNIPINTKENSFLGEKTPIFLTSNINIIKLLIDNGADTSIKDKRGDTFLDRLNKSNVKQILNLYPNLFKKYKLDLKIKEYNL